MYLSIGNDMAVRERSVIGIFDLDNTTTSKRTREFLNTAEKEGQVVPCDDLPKSFIVTDCSGTTLNNLMEDYGSYPIEEIVSPEGENVRGEEYYEFYADENALDVLILRLFYAPK